MDLMDGWNQRRVSSWWGSMGWNKDQDENGEVIELIVSDTALLMPSGRVKPWRSRVSLRCQERK